MFVASAPNGGFITTTSNTSRQIDYPQSLQGILGKQPPLIARFGGLGKSDKRLTESHFRLLPLCHVRLFEHLAMFAKDLADQAWQLLFDLQQNAELGQALEELQRLFK